MIVRDDDSIGQRIERLALALGHHDADGEPILGPRGRVALDERLMHGLEAEAEVRHEGTRGQCVADLSMQLLGLEGEKVLVRDYPDSPPRAFVVGQTCGPLPRHTEGHGGPDARLEYDLVEAA